MTPNPFKRLFKPGEARTDQGTRVSLDELIRLRVQAAGLALSGRRKVMTMMAGGHQSGFRGRGFDFSETRHYLPGDDIRAMDWRVTARQGIPHTKVFQEERERPVFIVTDYSPGMWFGTRTAFKSVAAARAAALLAWAAAACGERTGGLVFSHSGHREIRPAAGRRGVLRLLKTLADGVPAGSGYDINRALEQIRRVARPGSLVCMLSDFHDLDDSGETALTRLAKHADVLALFVYDHLETCLPPPGYYALSDGRQVTGINSADRRLREIYQQHFATRYQHLESLFTRRGLRLLPLATHDEVTETLRRGLGRADISGLSHAPAIEDYRFGGSN